MVVVDNFPSTEVEALLQMANATGDAADKAGSSSAVPQVLPRPAHGSLPGTSSCLFCIVQTTDKIQISWDMLTNADQEIGSKLNVNSRMTKF